jgi:hypothetical protein
MPLTRIPDIAFDLEGDLIHLEQNDGSGNVDAIVLHRLHLRHLAEEFGLLAPAPLPALPLDIADGADGMHELALLRGDNGTTTLLQTRVEETGEADAEIYLHPIQVAWLAAKLAALIASNGTPDQPEVSR